MGANTTGEIDRYSCTSRAKENPGKMLRLVRGVMVYVSGKVCQFFSADSVKVETPVGVVGLRGTEVAISLEGRSGRRCRTRFERRGRWDCCFRRPGARSAHGPSDARRRGAQRAGAEGKTSLPLCPTREEGIHASW